VDGDLANIVGIIWNRAGALVGVVVLMAPYVTLSGGRIKLACGEELEITVEETQEGNVSVSSVVRLVRLCVHVRGLFEKRTGSIVVHGDRLVWKVLLRSHTRTRILGQKKTRERLEEHVGGWPWANVKTVDSVEEFRKERPGLETSPTSDVEIENDRQKVA